MDFFQNLTTITACSTKMLDYMPPTLDLLGHMPRLVGRVPAPPSSPSTKFSIRSLTNRSTFQIDPNDAVNTQTHPWVPIGLAQNELNYTIKDVQDCIKFEKGCVSVRHASMMEYMHVAQNLPGALGGLSNAYGQLVSEVQKLEKKGDKHEREGVGNYDIAYAGYMDEVLMVGEEIMESATILLEMAQQALLSEEKRKSIAIPNRNSIPSLRRRFENFKINAENLRQMDIDIFTDCARFVGPLYHMGETELEDIRRICMQFTHRRRVKELYCEVFIQGQKDRVELELGGSAVIEYIRSGRATRRERKEGEKLILAVRDVIRDVRMRETHLLFSARAIVEDCGGPTWQFIYIVLRGPLQSPRILALDQERGVELA